MSRYDEDGFPTKAICFFAIFIAIAAMGAYIYFSVSSESLK